MRIFIILSSALVIGLSLSLIFNKSTPFPTGAPPYGESENDVPSINPYQWLKNWHRPDGPPRVGIQIGHYKNEQAPEEQRAEDQGDENANQVFPPFAQSPVAPVVGVSPENIHAPEPADHNTFEQAEKGNAPRSVDEVADHAQPVESSFGDIDDGNRGANHADDR